MIDFHTHILPGIDDGADSEAESIEMLKAEREQSVRHVFLTPHFYPDRENPEDFLLRRNESYAKLLKACEQQIEDPALLPQIHVGSEVYYFPGIGDCDSIRPLALGDIGCLLIEPPMTDWTSLMLDEIESISPNLGLVPVIAHVDRYCRALKDYSLFDRLKRRRVIIQVNASFFIHEDTRNLALELLEEGRIHLLGSDCHNRQDRRPNIGHAAENIRTTGHAIALAEAVKKMYQLIK